MALNFPNSPAEDQEYLDQNGRKWLFKNGYWQEVIVSFSIDLLRDVHTIIDTQSIVFVDSTGFQSSIDANVDLPFILSDDSVSNIPFTPYAFPFYLADGSYDGIDIQKQEPALNSYLVWDGTNWVPELLEYNTDDIIGINTSDAEADDTLVWQTDGYVADNVNNYITYNPPYFDQKISEIEDTTGYTTTSRTVGINPNFDTINCTTDSNMIDLANDRIICTSDGVYELFFETMMRVNEEDRYNEPISQESHAYVYDINDDLKYILDFGLNARAKDDRYTPSPPNSWGTTTRNKAIVSDYFPLEVGDYIKIAIRKHQQFGTPNSTTSFARMIMNKIGEFPYHNGQEFIQNVCINGETSTVGNPLIIVLPAGTYTMYAKKWTYTAISYSTGNWVWNVRYSSAEVPETVWNNPSGVQSSAQDAFMDLIDNGQTTKNFTLTYQQPVSFWYYDTNYTDNSGGTCFELWKTI
jgi:hypothetical protein